MSRVVEPQAPQAPQVPGAEAPAQRSRLVQRLLDVSADLPVFIKDLLTTQAVMVAGTEAAAFAPQQQGEQMGLGLVHHIRPDESSPEVRAAAIRAFQDILRPCVEQGKDGAIEVGAPDEGESQFCLVTCLRNEGQVVAVTAVITRCRDLERAKQRLTSMQLVAGYFDLYVLRKQGEQSKLVTDRHQHVLQFGSAVAMAEGFESSAMNLCNELAARVGASRVTLGWLKGRRIRVKALSHTEKFDKKQDLVVLLERVMEECLDQEEPVRFDPEGNSTENVSRAASDLSRLGGGGVVLSVPLRQREEVTGVLTLEFPPRTVWDPEKETTVAVASQILAPQLHDRYNNDRYIVTKMGLSGRWLIQKALLGKQYWTAKLCILAGLLLVGFLVQPWYQPMHRVRAPFQLVAQERHTITAPFDERLERVYVRPGQVVQAGQVLAELSTYEYRTQLARVDGEILKLVHQETLHRERNEIPEMRVAEAQRMEAEKEAEILRYYIAQARILAPVDGVVLRPDLMDRQGARVQRQDVLFELAAAHRNEDGSVGQIVSEVELLVSERDIQHVKRAHEQQRDRDGVLTTSSVTSRDFGFQITRIVPLGEPKDGENVFRVYATLLDPEPWVHPGLAGEARVHVEPRRIWWIWTHQVTDWIKLKLWL